MQSLALRAEQAEQFGRLVERVADPVRGTGVELRDLAGVEDDVLLAA